MGKQGVDLELVVSEDSVVTIPAADLASLPVVPGQRVRVRVEQIPSGRRDLLGVLAEPGRPVLTIDDFDALSDEIWRVSEHRTAGG